MPLKNSISGGSFVITTNYLQLCLYYNNYKVCGRKRVPALTEIQSTRLSIYSSELDPPPHPFGSRGGHTRCRGRGWGGSNSDGETDSTILYVYYNPSLEFLDLK
jgi:hypothetical protein